MASLGWIIDNIKDPEAHLKHRNGLMRKIEDITKRRLFVYASDITKSDPSFKNQINTMDKTGFAELMDGLACKEVDIFLQSPGGSAEATEQIVRMLRSNYESIRFIVPHTAKSAATLMALSGDAILMDERSELGPIDPQVPMVLPNGGVMFVPAQTVKDGFENARKILASEGPAAIPAFMPLLAKYDLHLLEICENAMDLAKTLAKTWVSQYMFKGEGKGQQIAEVVANELSDHRKSLSHARAVTIDDAVRLGLKVLDLRENPKLRDYVWELYCSIEYLFEKMPGLTKVFMRGIDGKGIFRLSQVQQLQIDLPLPSPPAAPPKPTHASN